jgi:putative peptide zinc metalloprotease protein
VGAGRAPSFGAHPRASYPPLAAPPGPPPSTSDEVDRRFERKLWWLLILLLLLALLLTGANFVAGPAWSEMPEDHALLRAAHGTTVARIDGINRVLNEGDEAYVSSTDVIRVGDRSDARLTFRGGGYTVLCGGSRLTVGPLSSLGRPVAPAGSLAMDSGKLLAYTTGTSTAFLPLALRVTSYGAVAQNAGAARYSVGWDGVDDSAGGVIRNGTPMRPTGDLLGCGDGRTVPVPGGSPSTSPSVSESPSESPSPSAAPSLSPSPSPTLSPTPRRSPTIRPTTPSPTASQPPANNPPTITWANGGDPGGGNLDTLYGTSACNQQRTTILYEVSVTDDHDTQAQLSVVFYWSGKYLTGSKKMGIRGPVFYVDLGQFTYQQDGNGAGDFLSIRITATDSGGKSSTINGKSVTVLSCTPVILR